MRAAPSHFHFSAQHVRPRSGRRALSDIVAYQRRTRERDLRDPEKVNSITAYMKRSFDLEIAAAEVGHHVLVTNGYEATSAELWDGIDRAARRRDGAYKMHAGHLPRLGSFITASFPYGIELAAAIDALNQFVTTIAATYGCALEAVIHIKSGRPDHAHIVMTDRVVRGSGIGKKIRAFNAVAEKAVGGGIRDGGKSIGSAMEMMRGTWAREIRRVSGDAAIDHRSYQRQGVPIKPVTHFRRGEIEAQTRAGHALWRDDRAREMADRYRPVAPSQAEIAFDEPRLKDNRKTRRARKKRASWTVEILEAIAPGQFQKFAVAGRIPKGLAFAIAASPIEPEISRPTSPSPALETSLAINRKRARKNAEQVPRGLVAAAIVSLPDETERDVDSLLRSGSRSAFFATYSTLRIAEEKDGISAPVQERDAFAIDDESFVKRKKNLKRAVERGRLRRGRLATVIAEAITKQADGRSLLSADGQDDGLAGVLPSTQKAGLTQSSPEVESSFGGPKAVHDGKALPSSDRRHLLKTPSRHGAVTPALRKHDSITFSPAHPVPAQTTIDTRISAASPTSQKIAYVAPPARGEMRLDEKLQRRGSVPGVSPGRDDYSEAKPTAGPGFMKTFSSAMAPSVGNNAPGPPDERMAIPRPFAEPEHLTGAFDGRPAARRTSPADHRAAKPVEAEIVTRAGSPLEKDQAANSKQDSSSTKIPAVSPGGAKGHADVGWKVDETSLNGPFDRTKAPNEAQRLRSGSGPGEGQSVRVPVKASVRRQWPLQVQTTPTVQRTSASIENGPNIDVTRSEPEPTSKTGQADQKTDRAISVEAGTAATGTAFRMISEGPQPVTPAHAPTPGPQTSPVGSEMPGWDQGPPLPKLELGFEAIAHPETTVNSAADLDDQEIVTEAGGVNRAHDGRKATTTSTEGRRSATPRDAEEANSRATAHAAPKDEVSVSSKMRNRAAVSSRDRASAEVLAADYAACLHHDHMLWRSFLEKLALAVGIAMPALEALMTAREQTLFPKSDGSVLDPSAQASNAKGSVAIREALRKEATLRPHLLAAIAAIENDLITRRRSKSVTSNKPRKDDDLGL